MYHFVVKNGKIYIGIIILPHILLSKDNLRKGGTKVKLLGKPVASSILDEVKKQVNELDSKPKLVVVKAKNFDNASNVYVNKKIEACKNNGMDSEIIELEFNNIDKNTFLEILKDTILKLNKDNSTHGYLIQLPLPFGISQNDFAHFIDSSKDVDGFHYENTGKIFEGELNSCLIPCTPNGVVEILKYYNIPLKGKDVVIINRSGIVGKPLIHLLLKEDCTVTICHSKTVNIKEKCGQADIVISGVGIKDFMDSSWFKKGATVIDVSVNFDSNGKLCGDLRKDEYDLCEEKGINFTPVPGGVGVVTVAMVAHNLLKAYKLQMRNC